MGSKYSDTEVTDIISADVQEGIDLFNSGQYLEAKKFCHNLLENYPDDAELYSLLAAIYYAEKDDSKALEYIERALSINKKPDYFHTAGVILLELGRYEDAASYLEVAVENNPAVIEFYVSLALVYNKLNNFQKEQIILNQAISLSPNSGELYIALGASFALSKDYEKSYTCYKKAVVVEHGNISYMLKLAGICLKLNKFAEVEKFCTKVLNQEQQNIYAYNLLATAYMAQRKYKKAIGIYNEALEINHEALDVHDNLCKAYYMSGYYNETIKALDNFYKVNPDDRLVVSRSIILPPVMLSREAIDESRENFMHNISQLKQSGMVISEPEKNIVLPFYQLYHGKNNKELLTELADLFCKICPQLNYTAAHCSNKVGNKPLRLACVMHYPYENPMGKMHYDPFLQMEKFSDFDVSFFTSTLDDIGYLSDSNVTLLPHNMEEAKQMLEKGEFDIIYYSHLPLHSLHYFLAFHRLAKVQCTSQGCSETSGIASIDYYFSFSAIEKDDAQQYYSETLVNLDNVFFGFKHLRYEGEIGSNDKSYFGISEDKKTYFCPMSIHKLHPDYDIVMREILSKDDNAEIVLISNTDGMFRIQEKMLERFQITMPDVMDRIKFVDYMKKSDFLNLLQISDAVIDTFPFGGNSTYYTLFSIGVPIVTLPGDLGYSRYTAALYKQMGVTDLIAKNVDDFIDKAIGLANDNKLKSRISSRIKDSVNSIYENRLGVKNLADFFRGGE